MIWMLVCQEKGKDKVKETVSVCVASGLCSQSISLMGTGRLTWCQVSFAWIVGYCWVMK